VFSPEYTITSDILKNVSGIEYAKAIIENTPLLSNWENQLIVDAKTRTISYAIQKDGTNINPEDIKKLITNLPTKVPHIAERYLSTLELSHDYASTKELTEEDIADLYKALTGTSKYRNTPSQKGVPADEILAQMVELVDWLQSVEALQTHPMLLAYIVKLNIEIIQPFEKHNSLLADLISDVLLESHGYNIKGYFCPQEYEYKTYLDYQELIDDARKSYDLTQWLEYTTDIAHRELSTVADKIKMLAKDAKIAKAAGRAKLSQRHERIISYLQDYVLIQNKDFPALFPNLSEDTILRDLKKLIDMGIVVKLGSTKSSRYELSN